MSEQDVIDGEVRDIVPHSGSSKLQVMPAASLAVMGERRKQMVGFVRDQMIEDIDFGTIPGTNKPTLYKPGAEKLTTFFGLTPIFSDESVIEDFDKPLFYYRRKCQLWRGDYLVAEGSGSCNSMEDRYAWRWVASHEVPRELDRSTMAEKVSSIGEWGWAVDKRETTGKYGKPESYWEQFDKARQAGTLKVEMKPQPWKDGKEAQFLTIETVVYRVPNENIYTLTNTILKMADKRALVSATLIAVNASEFFTQDLEDMGAVLDDDAPTPKQESKPAPARQSSPPPPPAAPAQTSQAPSKPKEPASQVYSLAGLSVESCIETAKKAVADPDIEFDSQFFWALCEAVAPEKLGAVTAESVTALCRPIADNAVMQDEKGVRRTNWRKATVLFLDLEGVK